MRIAVVIPVRNGEKIIARCLAGIADQTRLPDALVVADNSSTDATASQVQQAAAPWTFPWQLITVSAPGPSAARNAGLKALGMDCEVVAFLDADCVPRLDWLEQIEAFFLSHSQAAGLGGVTWGYQPRTMMQKFIAIQRYHYSRKAASGWVPSPYDIFKGTFIDTNNAAFRQDALAAVGGFDETLQVLEDADLCLRVLKNQGRLFIFHPCLVVYHEDAASVAGYFRKFLFYRQEEQKVYKKHFGHSWVIKLPRLPLRIVPGKNTGGMVNGETVLLFMLLAGFWIAPLWVLAAIAAYAGFWMIRFLPYLRHAEFRWSSAWLPVFWFWFVLARVLGRGARWWGGIRYRYWVV